MLKRPLGRTTRPDPTIDTTTAGSMWFFLVLLAFVTVPIWARFNEFSTRQQIFLVFLLLIILFLTRFAYSKMIFTDPLLVVKAGILTRKKIPHNGIFNVEYVEVLRPSLLGSARCRYLIVNFRPSPGYTDSISIRCDNPANAKEAFALFRQFSPGVQIIGLDPLSL